MSTDALISKLTVKSQTVIPQAVRKALGLEPGDYIRFRQQGGKVEIEKLDLQGGQDDPFLAFTEWASPADDDAYRDL